MNKADLAKYLKNPEDLDKQSIQEVNLLKDEFPYFQTAHLLATKNHHNIGSADFEKTLHLAAAYISDRRVLYDLLFDPGLTAIRMSKEKPAAAAGRIIKDSLKDNISETLTSQIRNLEKTDYDNMELIPEVAIDVRKEYGKGVELDDLDLRITLSPEGDEYLEIESTEGEVAVEEKPAEPVVEEEPEILELEGQVFDLQDDHAGSMADESKDTAEVQTVQEGMVIPDHDEPIEFDLEEKDTDAPAVDSEETIKAKDDEPADQSVKKISNDVLIDNFISKGSGKIIPADDSGEHVDISEESVREHEGFITDTLAKIYIRQGYYSKAIFAYEKLILKFPEKSSYFAAQIEKIKKIVRNL
jgi:tetratricopeptide (TPR) repeat protein